MTITHIPRSKAIGAAMSAFGAFAATFLYAQDSSSEPDDEFFELSPFTVNASESVGYLANNTLAGTRIATKLEDVANSVQVLTEEFLNDTGATSVNELLIYTTGTEASGVNGNASFGEINSNTERGERARREPQLNTRVRGLALADLARDYFISDVAFDPYNASTVTINRGPNASLFGLGSPGGIINQTIDRAETHRTFGRVDLKVDEFGTIRSSLNYNQVILEDKLAVRVAYLNADKRYEMKDAGMQEDRYFVALTWRPMKNMAISANYETGEDVGIRPKLRPPTDHITGWFNNGKPSYNVFTNEWFIDGELVTDPAYVTQLNRSSFAYGTWGGGRNSPTLIYTDPTDTQPGGNTYAIMQTGVNSATPGRTDASQYPGNQTRIMRTFWGPTRLLRNDPAYIVGGKSLDPRAANFYSYSQFINTDVIDTRGHSLSALGLQRHLQEFEVSSFRLEKTWLDNNLGLELAHQKQYWEADLIEAGAGGDATNIKVDINLTLMDGTPNPNYGRPYIGSSGYAQAKIREREASQAIGFAKYDFRDKHDGLLRHFGRHALTAVYQDQKNEETAPNRQNARAGSDWKSIIGQADNPRVAAFPQRTQIHQYLGPSMVNVSSIDDVEIHPVTVAQPFVSTDNALKWNPETGQFEAGSVLVYSAMNDPEQVWTWGNPGNRDEISSVSTVLQSHFLNDNIVTTVSWRKDDVKTFTGAALPDPATSLYGFDHPIVYGDALFDDSVQQRSYGIVGHLPDRWLPDGLGLSVHYVDSSNFAAGTAGNDIFNRPAPLQSGTTEEYGFSFSALDGQFYARVNFFETLQDWVKITGVLPQIGLTIVSVMENNTPEALEAAGWSLTDGSLFNPDTIKALNIRNEGGTWFADNIAGTATNYYQNTASDGMEIEVSYAPKSNWRIHFNVAKVEAYLNNVMPIAGPELTRIANEVFRDPVIGNLFTTPSPTQNPDGSYVESGLLRSAADGLLSQIAIKKGPENGPSQELRKWRANLVTNYTFSDNSFLAGFGVGTGIRWQDKVAIGSGLKEVAGEIVPDWDNPYYGPSEIAVDAWINYTTVVMEDKDLHLQLRFRNLTDGSGEYIPIKANPDGEVALWRFGAPAYVEFSAGLRF